MRIAGHMQERSVALEGALQDFASVLHRIALLQTVPDAVPADEPDRDRLQALVPRFSAADLQLDYQIALQGRADLSLAPDEYAGFTMTLLRMLAFAPQEGGSNERAAVEPRTEKAPSRSPRGDRSTQPNAATGQHPDKADGSSPLQPTGLATGESRSGGTPGTAADAGNARPEVPGAEVATPTPSTVLDWTQLLSRLKIGGMARMLAQHSALASWDGQVIKLEVPEMHKHLLEKPYRDKLHAALEEYFKRRVRLEFSLGQPTGQTPAEQADRAQQVRQAAAVQSIDRDPFVRDLVENFDARVVDESIRPLNPPVPRAVDESIQGGG
jgi:DNA polymerase-3 subunit gamma/tau